MLHLQTYCRQIFTPNSGWFHKGMQWLLQAPRAREEGTIRGAAGQFAVREESGGRIRIDVRVLIGLV